MKAARRAVTKILKEELTQYDNFALPLILFFNSASTTSSSRESSKVLGLISPRMGKSNWVATFSKVTMISPQERKKVWVVVDHRQTKWQMLKVSL